MNVLCSAKACPVLLSSTCVFYEGENLIYTGINTNDNLQEALQKIDEAFGNAVLNISAVLPISITAGPNPIISISQASATSNGYISSIDWNTFNNKQNAVSLTTTGSSGPATFNGLSGALNIPDYSGSFSGFVPITRTLSINGTSYDLSANRSWTIDTLYTANGSLTSNRTVTMGAFTLSFEKDLFINNLRVGRGFGDDFRSTVLGNTSAQGVYTVAIGYQAATLTTGQGNVAIGYGALTSNTTGTNNTAVGMNAVRSVTTSIGNTGTGINALWGITSGSYNTGLGFRAGQYITGSAVNQTSSYSVYIGTDSKAFANGDTNEIVIGYNAVGIGSNTTVIGNSSIISTHLAGNLLLGSTVDTGLGKLQVTGAIQQSSVISSMLKTNSSGVLVAAAAGTDYQAPITLTVTGNSGFSTFIANTLNVPTYTLSGLGGVPTSRTLTINGTSYDLSADRTWSVGTVTSVDMSVPTGFSISGNPITSSGTFAVTFASGYSLPTNTSQSNWDTAYNNRITSLTTTGSSGVSTLISNTLNIPNYTLSGLGGNLQAVTDLGSVTTNSITVASLYLTNMTAGSGALYYGVAQNRLTLANYNVGGSVYIEVNGGSYSAVFGSDLSFTSYGTIGGVFNASAIDTDKFIVSDGGILKYRTGAEVLSDIGAQAAGSYVPTSRTLTINGTAYDLSADRSWSVGTVTGSGTTNILPKWTSSTSLGNSLLDDDGTSASVALASGGAFNIKYLSAIKLALTGGTTFGSIDVPIGLDFLIRPDSIEKFKLSSTGLLKLAQYGSGTVTGTSTYRLAVDATGNVIEVTDGGGTVTGTGAAGQVAYWTGTSSQTGSNNLFWDAANAKLGIGTNSPQTTLHIQGGLGSFRVLSSGAEVYLTRDGNNDFLANGGTSAELSVGANNALKFWTGTTLTERARVTAAGRLLLGTTTEGTNILEVNGTARVNTDLYVHNASGEARIEIGRSITGARTVLFSNFSAGLVYYNSGFSNYVYYYDPSTNTLLFQTNGSDRLTIDSTGAATFSSLAGTGTRLVVADTNGLLSTQSIGGGVVTGTGTTNYLPKFIGTSAIGNSLVYDNGTNVGIGTTSPSVKLDVVGSATISGIASLGTSQTTTLAYIGDFNTVGTRYIRFSRASALINIVNIQGVNGGIGADNIALQAEGGMVGIGSTDPQRKLDSYTLGGASFANNYARLGVGAQGAFGGSNHLEFSYNDYGNIGGRAFDNIVAKIQGSTDVVSSTDVGGVLIFSTKDKGGTYLNAPSEKMRITSGGNVGIGTTSPTSKLDVFGEGRFNVSAAANTTTTALTLVNTTDDVNNGVRIGWKPYNASFETAYITTIREGANAFSSLVFATSTNGWGVGAPTERLRITSTGNMGLGVVPSAYSLGKVVEVGTLGNAFWGVGINSVQLTSNYFYDGSYKYANNGYANRYDIGSSGGSHIWFNAPSGTAGNAITFTQAMTLDASGNLGIGTTNPYSKLHVVSGDTGNTYPSTASINVSNYDSAAFGRTTGINFSVGSGVSSELIAGVYGVYTNYNTSVGGALAFITNNGSGSFTEKMRITSGGSVLLGSSVDSGERLQVNGAINATNAILLGGNSDVLNFKFSSGYGNTSLATIYDSVADAGNHLIFKINNAAGTATERMRIVGNGNVGIGTTTPLYKLDVLKTTVGSIAQFIVNDGTYNPRLLINGTAEGIQLFATYSTIASDLMFGTGYTERMRITGSGNLLVGTTVNQGYRVQITSASGDSHLNVWGAVAPSIRIDNAASGATQRLAIGLSTASSNFITTSVAGDICITTQSANPLLFGSNATEAMRISTSANILINKTADGGQPLQVSGKVNFASLPTSSAGLLSGDIWNDSGTLKIV